MDIQWYPGHMTKAMRQMQNDIRLVDLVIELLDARIPHASKNPDIDRLAGDRAWILILNKADIADPNVTEDWIAYFRAEGYFVLKADARERSFKKQLAPVVEEATKKKRDRDRKRGIRNRPVRSMVAGVPNCGKSTFINTYAGRASAKTGNRPGVTKGNQWIRLGKGLELLDTPGVLWPKFEDPDVGFALACAGSIRQERFSREVLTQELIRRLQADYPQALPDAYGVSDGQEPSAVLEQLAKKRGCIKTGGEADIPRAADLLLDDFRSGRLGRISLEKP